MKLWILTTFLAGVNVGCAFVWFTTGRPGLALLNVFAGLVCINASLERYGIESRKCSKCLFGKDRK